MTQQQTPNEPTKLSERGALRVAQAIFGSESKTPLKSLIADSTGCDEAMELLRECENGIGCISMSPTHECRCWPCRLAAYLKKYGGSTNEG